LLQRVRAGPGPQERVRGGDPPLHPVGHAGQAPPGAQRRNPVARLHLHRQRRVRQPARGSGARSRRLGQGLQRGLRQSHEPPRHHRVARAPPRPPPGPQALADPGGRRAAHPGRHQRGQARHGLRADRGLRRGAAADRRLLHGGDTMTMRRGWVLALLVLLAAVVPGPVSPAEAQGNLAVQVPAEPPGLHLTASPASAIAAIVHYNVQECLVKVDKSGKLVPWLADRWYTTDSKNYTFFLRKGVRFHNGRELRAADVKFVLERAANPETKHPFQKRYEIIREIIVKDDYTVSIALKAVNANFLLEMARQGSVIYPREAVETLKSAPMGTGPFTVADWWRGGRGALAK